LVERLSRGQFWFCFAVAMTVFFFFQGPFWKHGWQLDGSILYSYAVVPVVVFTLLAWKRKLGLGVFVLGTLEVTLWKFASTYVVAHTVWMFTPPPARVPLPAEKVVEAPDTPVVPSPIAPSATGAVEGSVESNDGRNARGAIVFVESGVEAYTFAPSAHTTSFEVGGAQIAPLLAVAELHQDLKARSSDGKLHTLIATAKDGDLFNMPLQSSGAWSGAQLRRGQGVAKLRCAVHERSHESARLIVVAHPFHAELDEGGRFHWSGLPAGRITVVALHPDGREAHGDAEIMAGHDVQMKLILTAGQP
jgi:hypothetical protein